MLVNDECSSWCNVEQLFQNQFRIGEKKFYTAMDQHAWPDRTTPLQIQSVWTMGLKAMMVECNQVKDIDEEGGESLPHKYVDCEG